MLFTQCDTLLATPRTLVLGVFHNAQVMTIPPPPHAVVGAVEPTGGTAMS